MLICTGQASGLNCLFYKERGKNKLPPTLKYLVCKKRAILRVAAQNSVQKSPNHMLLMLLSVHTENKAAHWICLVSLAGKSSMSSAWRGREEWGLVGRGHYRQEVLLVCHHAEQKSQVQMMALLLTFNKSFPRSLLLLPLTYSVLISSHWGFGWGLSVSTCQYSI